MFPAFKKKRQDKDSPWAEEQERTSQQSLGLPPQSVPEMPQQGLESEARAQEPFQENSGQAEEEQQEAPNQENQEDPEWDESEPKDTLLDIFKSEEVQDVEFSALTEGLEDIDIQDLLLEARNVAQRLGAKAPRDKG